MKKLKKLLCSVLALSMFPMTGIMHASAAHEFSLPENAYTAARWSYSHATPANMGDYADYNYGEPTKTEKYSGSYSWHIQNAQPKAVSNTYINSSVGITGKLPAGTYYVSFMKKGYSDWTEFHLAWNALKSIIGNSADWTKQEFILTTTKESDWISFTTDRNTDMYIDDLEVYKVEAVDDEKAITLENYKKVGDNYIVNGNVEDAGEKLSNDDSRQYYMLSSWSDYYGNATLAPEADNYIRPTTKYARTGDYGVYVKSTNLNNDSNKYVFVETPYSVSVPAGTYNLEIWVKTNYGYDLNGKFVSMCFEGTQAADKLSTFTKGETDENGWTRYTKEFTFSSDTSKKFWLYVGTIGEFAFDDVAFYKTDDENKTNLLLDGSFEDVIGLPEGKYKADDWDFYFDGKDYIPERRTNFIVTEPSADEKYSGNYSMHIAYPYGARENREGRYVMPIQWNCNMPAGTYYVTYMKKGINNMSYFTTSSRGTAQMTTPGTGNGRTDWVKVENVITQTANSSWVSFLTESWSDLYIDDVEVYAVEAVEENGDFVVNGKNYKKTSETNYIKNGGFEAVKEVVVSPVKVSATPVKAASTLDVVWVNPNKPNIIGASIYVDGKEARVKANLTANASNSVMVSGLENGKAVEVKVVLTYADGTTTTATTTGTPNDLGSEVYFGNWKYTKIDGSHGDAVIDTNEKYAGNASLRVDVNLPKTESNKYVRVASNSFTLTGKETYVLKFKYKADNIARFNIIFEGEGDENWIVKNVISQNTTNGWTEGEVEYTPASFAGIPFTSKVVILVEQGTGSLWLDDVELHGVDIWDDTVNLGVIEDSGFEFADLTISQASYNLVAEDGTKTPITALQAGNVEVTSKIKNNAKGDSFKAALIVALYNGKALVDVGVCEKTVAQKAVGYPADELSASVIVPAGEGYTLKVMWWNGLDSLTPLRATDGI